MAARLALAVDIPGSEPLRLEHLVLDVNGTLTDRASLIEGVQERLGRLREALDVTLLSADTFGNLDAIAEQLGLKAARISRGEEKLAYVERLGPERCAAIGNGANDAAMLGVARLGIAVVGREGASAITLRAADLVCGSIVDALDLLLNPLALMSTLRS
jgi:P-type E1-E2 ATPase